MRNLKFHRNYDPREKPLSLAFATFSFMHGDLHLYLQYTWLSFIDMLNATDNCQNCLNSSELRYDLSEEVFGLEN